MLQKHLPHTHPCLISKLGVQTMFPHTSSDIKNQTTGRTHHVQSSPTNQRVVSKEQHDSRFISTPTFWILTFYPLETMAFTCTYACWCTYGKYDTLRNTKTTCKLVVVKLEFALDLLEKTLCKPMEHDHTPWRLGCKINLRLLYC